ncbi:MAG: hypothetical protein MI862_26755 [Desulfobacterales bacterium]|nr:hypothetical protein [Desulfobacterales bacterium]
MGDLYFDKKHNKRQSLIQLQRRGLTGVDLETLDIVELVIDHGIDTDIYIAIDTGGQEERDGKMYVIFDQKIKTDIDVKSVLKSKINNRRDEIFLAGVDFDYDGKTHTLQTRDAEDLINWTHVLNIASSAPVDQVITIRTKENVTLSLAANKVAPLISTGVLRRKAVMQASWDLKSAIDDAAEDAAAVAAYEAGIDTVWPDASPIPVV